VSSGLVLLAVLCPVFFVWFVRLEERGQPEVPLAVIVGLVLLESVLYQSQNYVPGGIFHPSLGSQSLRLPDVLIPIALLARVSARGGPRRIGLTAGAWSAFLVWYLVSFAISFLTHNPFSEAFFQLKVIIYLGGGFLLAVGVPPARLTNERLVRRITIVTGVVVTAFIATHVSGQDIPLPLPIAPGAAIGRVGADASTIAVTLAMVAVLLEAARSRRRALVAIACIPLLLSPIAATQRAAVIGLLASVAFVLVFMATRRWRWCIRATATEVVLLVAIVLMPLLLTIAVRAVTAPSANPVPIQYSNLVEKTFFSKGKAQSADIRRNMWSTGLDYAKDYPVTGWGLGKSYNVPDTGSFGGRIIGSAYHDIVIDILVRSGAVGVALLLFALACSIRDMFLAWLRHRDRIVAALVLGCGAGVTGLVAKAAVESIFEKFRLAVILGVLLGIISAAAAEVRSGEPATEPTDRVVGGNPEGQSPDPVLSRS
jgi:O-antigen ligase